MNEEPEFTIIQDTREQTPWIFDYEKSIAQEIGTLKTGDYTLKGLENKICIERKGCIEEFANNLGRDFARFKKELIRMDEYPHSFIVCEFPLRDLIEYPFHKPNKKLQSTAKIGGRYLLKQIMEIQIEHNVKIIFCGSKFYAIKSVLSLLKRIHEKYRPKT
jgi:DNA excision repair protein ERCC-4